VIKAKGLLVAGGLDGDIQRERVVSGSKLTVRNPCNALVSPKLLELQAEVLADKSAQDLVQIVDGRVVEGALVVRVRVPDVWEW
jgi:hypothetical protein